MKSKIKSIFAVGGFIMAIGTSLVFGIKEQPLKVEAAEGDRTVYINTADGKNNMGSGWEDSADSFAWAYNNDAGTHEYIHAAWISDNIRSFVLPSKYPSFTLCRFSNSDTPAEGQTTWKDCWTQTYDITPSDSLNYFSLGNYNYGDGKTEYVAVFVREYKAGESIYLDVQGNESWWFDASYHTYAQFNIGNYKRSVELNRIGSTNIVMATLTADIEANYIIFYRSTDSDFSHKTNQTPNIVISYGDRAKTAFKLGVDHDGSSPCTGMEEFSDAYVADSFGYYFLNDITICLDAGGLADGAISAWNGSEDVYDDYKSLLTNINYIASASNVGDANINLALLRYDTARSKNPAVLTNNYLNRNLITLNNQGIFRFGDGSNNMTTFLTIGGIITTLIVATFLFLKRKRS